MSSSEKEIKGWEKLTAWNIRRRVNKLIYRNTPNKAGLALGILIGDGLFHYVTKSTSQFGDTGSVLSYSSERASLFSSKNTVTIIRDYVDPSAPIAHQRRTTIEKRKVKSR